MNRNNSTDIPVASVAPSPTGETPFDLWLQRGLHQLFDAVANEPIPEDLLKLIESDRESQ